MKMGIKKKLTDRAEASSIALNLKIAGQNEFIKQIMNEDGIDEETARALCYGETDPVDYHYTLGYKMSDPVWELGMFKQIGKKAREKARENFRKTLCPGEQVLFDEIIEDMTERWKKEKLRD